MNITVVIVVVTTPTVIHTIDLLLLLFWLCRTIEFAVISSTWNWSNNSINNILVFRKETTTLILLMLMLMLMLML